MCLIEGNTIRIVLLSFSFENKNEEEFVLKSLLPKVFKNKGFAKLFCAFTETENPAKKNRIAIVCAANVLMK